MRASTPPIQWAVSFLCQKFLFISVITKYLNPVLFFKYLKAIFMLWSCTYFVETSIYIYVCVCVFLQHLLVCDISFHFNPSWLTWIFLITYYKAKLKSNVQAIVVQHLLVSDHSEQQIQNKCFSIQALPWISFTYTVINLTNFMGPPTPFAST